MFQPDPANDNQILIPQSRFCKSSHMWYFAGVLYAIKGLQINDFYFSFLSRVSILLLTRDIDIVILSVCPSVRLSVCP